MQKLVIILAIGLFSITNASAQSWVYDAFSSAGSSYNANNHNVTQGAAGYGTNVQQPQPYMQPNAAPAPQPYQYNAQGGYVQNNQGSVHLNPQLTNPNNFSYMRPPPPPPPAPVYRAPAYVPPQTTFRRVR